MEYNMIFVLGYDLLHDQLVQSDLSCDEAYGVCVDVYNAFLESEYATQNTSEYDALSQYIAEHEGEVERLIEVNGR